MSVSLPRPPSLARPQPARRCFIRSSPPPPPRLQVSVRAGREISPIFGAGAQDESAGEQEKSQKGRPAFPPPVARSDDGAAPTSVPLASGPSEAPGEEEPSSALRRRASAAYEGWRAWAQGPINPKAASPWRAAHAASGALFRVRARMQRADVLPPVGGFEMSYAQLLQLLAARRVKRLIVLGDGRAAIVEVPVPNTESDPAELRHDELWPERVYAREPPEWAMEKNRYFCRLPGDAWERGTLLRLVKDNQRVTVLDDGGVLREPYEGLLRSYEVRPELEVFDPDHVDVVWRKLSHHFYTIAVLLGSQSVLGALFRLWQRFVSPRLQARRERDALGTLGQHKAVEYLGGGSRHESGGEDITAETSNAVTRAPQGISDVSVASQHSSSLPPIPFRASPDKKKLGRGGEVELGPDGRPLKSPLKRPGSGRAPPPRDSGIRFEDCAGMEDIVQGMRETLEVLLDSDGHYAELGVHPPRGILLEGPPGTGKTLLARAMAGEAGIPFFSANGADFVEMYAGVAAARVASLFAAARAKAPAIVFIDEIDALAASRADRARDPGARERQQGLLALLAEMDGVERGDGVLVLGATNHAQALDAALLRPGRFDRRVRVGLPGPAARGQILALHAADKPVGEGVEDRKNILAAGVELTVGWSGAELSNLLNEAAILSVRGDAPHVSETLLRAAALKLSVGLPGPAPQRTEALRRLAELVAARAIALALTPGMPSLRRMSMACVGGDLGHVSFRPRERSEQSRGAAAIAATLPGAKSNLATVPLSSTPYDALLALMVPLYAARAWESVAYGPDGLSLASAPQLAAAGALASWVVRDSKLHPLARRQTPLLHNLPHLGGAPDPISAHQHDARDADVLAIQTAAHDRARALLAERAAAVRAAAAAMLDAPDGSLGAERLFEILRDQAPSPVPEEVRATLEERKARRRRALAWLQDQHRVWAPAQEQDGEAASPPPTEQELPKRRRGRGRKKAAGAASRAPASPLAPASLLAPDPLISPQQTCVLAVAESVVGMWENWDFLTPDVLRAQLDAVAVVLQSPQGARRAVLAAEFARSSDPAAPMPPAPPLEEALLAVLRQAENASVVGEVLEWQGFEDPRSARS